MMWGPVMFPSQIQDDLNTGTEPRWRRIGAGCLLVFELEVAGMACCPGCSPYFMSFERKTRYTSLWVGKLITVPADSFRLCGKNKICQVP